MEHPLLRALSLMLLLCCASMQFLALGSNSDPLHQTTLVQLEEAASIEETGTRLLAAAPVTPLVPETIGTILDINSPFDLEPVSAPAPALAQGQPGIQHTLVALHFGR